MCPFLTFLVFNLLRVQAEDDLEDGKQENEETNKVDETEEPEKLTDEVFTVTIIILHPLPITFKNILITFKWSRL